MTTELTNLTFEAWLIYIFDHPVTEPKWYYLPDAECWDEDANLVLTLEYLTRLFENAEVALAPYTNDQIAQGLWFIASPSISNYLIILRDEMTIPFDTRKRCVDAMYRLFADLFAKRCSVDKNAEDNPLEVVCSMWWEVIPIYGDSYWSQVTDGGKFETAFMDMMERVLYIDHALCREATVNGLAHWIPAHPAYVADIMERFLASDLELSSEIRARAERALNHGRAIERP